MATHYSTGAYGQPTGSAPEFAPANALPRNVSERIWAAAREQAIFPSLSDNVPVILGENVFPTLTKRPAASIVGEGGEKSDSQIAFGSKTMRPMKAVVGLEFTMEAVRQNPLGVLGMLEAELSGALARQIDLAIAHGRQASDGSLLQGGTLETLTSTSKRVYLKGDDAPVNFDAALWQAYGEVINAGSPAEGEDGLLDPAKAHDFTGFALDPRGLFLLANERDSEGRRVNEINMTAGIQNYAGVPVTTGRGVSGQMDACPDSKVRAIGGDWNALKFGYALDIFVKKIEYGDPFGHGDLQRRNAVAYMAEVVFGFVIMDTDAFALVIDDEPEAEGGSDD